MQQAPPETAGSFDFSVKNSRFGNLRWQARERRILKEI
jgi:hypothetical protein